MEWKKVGVAVNHLNVIVQFDQGLKVEEIDTLPLSATVRHKHDFWAELILLLLLLISDCLYLVLAHLTDKEERLVVHPTTRARQPTPNLLLNSPGVSTENLQSG